MKIIFYPCLSCHPCNFSFSNGGSGSIAVTSTNADCAWTAASNVNWITVYNTSGSGDGTVNYTVTANPDFTERTGTITIGGQTFTVTQAARATTTSVNITYPSSGAVFNLPTNVFVSANANNMDGTIARVEFYADSQLIGTDISAPYQIVWNNVFATNYTLTAKSFDQNSAETLSEPVTISVNPVPPPAPAPLPIPSPTLTSPTANQVFNAGESIVFNAVPGASGDKPVPADYDGDGKADTVVFRPSNRVWCLLQSQSGFSASEFGLTGDIPIPSPNR